jgi:hypothetical protein
LRRPGCPCTAELNTALPEPTEVLRDGGTSRLDTTRPFLPGESPNYVRPPDVDAPAAVAVGGVALQDDPARTSERGAFAPPTSSRPAPFPREAARSSSRRRACPSVPPIHHRAPGSTCGTGGAITRTPKHAARTVAEAVRRYLRCDERPRRCDHPSVDLRPHERASAGCRDGAQESARPPRMRRTLAQLLQSNGLLPGRGLPREVPIAPRASRPGTPFHVKRRPASVARRQTHDAPRPVGVSERSGPCLRIGQREPNPPPPAAADGRVGLRFPRRAQLLGAP